MDDPSSSHKDPEEELSLSVSRRLRNQRNSIIYYLSQVPPLVEDKLVPSELYGTISSQQLVQFPILTEELVETDIVPRVSVKRGIQCSENDDLLKAWNARRNCLIDALLQTKIPPVPEDMSLNEEEQDTYSEVLNHPPEMPSINYFSNDVLYYNNGILERPVVDLPHPVVHHLSFSDLSWSDEESSEEDESMNSFDDDSAHSVCCNTLKDYLCPICLESPHTPVSTLCGHIFCEKCIRKMFKQNCIEWKCPQCRAPLTLEDFHPIYLP